MTPAPVWYLAEGSEGGYFDETLALFNTTARPMRVVLQFYGTTGFIGSVERWIPTGPGRDQVKLADLGWLSGEHGTVVQGFDAGTGAPAALVVERTMSWATGDERETHSTPGSAVTSPTWAFAEGSQGTFETYLSLFNPGATATTADVTYLHESGAAFPYAVAVPAGTRTTLLTPATLPAGAYGVWVQTPASEPIVVERSMYANADWSVGTSGIGSPTAAPQWTVAEGTVSGLDTYVLVANPGPVAVTATVTFLLDTGTSVATVVGVPAWNRAAVSATGVAGVSGGFQVVVSADGPVVVERAMYWPGGHGRGRRVEPRPRGGPTPYVSLAEAVPIGPTSLARAVGRVSPEEDAAVAAAGPPEAPRGRPRPRTVPWSSGHVVLGRPQ